MGTARILEWDINNDRAAGGVDLTVDFDPKSLSLTHSPQGRVAGSVTAGAESSSRTATQQTGETMTLSFELVFDTSATGESVQTRTDQLVALTRTAPAGSGAPLRKVLRFSWGAFLFCGSITSLTQTIDFFSADGVPLRSQVQLSLTEVRPATRDGDAGGGGLGGAIGASASVGASASFGASAGIGAGASIGASAGVSAGASAGASVGTTPLTLSQAGDSVQDITARAGGSVSWKEVAAANGIENPRLVAPGTILDAHARLEVG